MNRKLNLLDVFVILIILVAVLAVSFKFFALSDILTGNKMQKVVYTIEVKNLRSVSQKTIPENGEILDMENHKLGKVVGKVTKPAMWDIAKANGDFDYVERPNRYDVILTVEADGLQKDEGFFLYGSKSVGVGSNLKIKNQKVVFEAYVTDINVSQ